MAGLVIGLMKSLHDEVEDENAVDDWWAHMVERIEFCWFEDDHVHVRETKNAHNKLP
jgi:hypothetical protein